MSSICLQKIQISAALTTTNQTRTWTYMLNNWEIEKLYNIKKNYTYIPNGHTTQ